MEEIGDPIAVVASGFLLRRPLNRLVLHHRPDPDRTRAQRLDIIKLLRQALEIAAVVERLRRGIEPGLEPVSVEAAAIVGGTAVREAVGEHEVDHVLFRRAGQIIGRGLGQGR
jgi:hypothetical protein